MKVTNEEILFFFKHCLNKSNDPQTQAKLIELTLSSKQLSRFAALLDVDSTQIKHKNLAFRAFNQIKTEIIAKNLSQQSFIRKLLPKIAEKNIKIILLKSSAYNGYIYENSKPRGNSDIDLLVHPKDRETFEEILSELADQHIPIKPKPFEGLYETTWISKLDKALFIDLHYNLTNPIMFNISHNELFKLSLKSPSFNDEHLRILSPEMNYAHCAIHIIGDGYLPHHSVLDAIMLLKKTKISNELLENIALTWKCKKATSLLNSYLDMLDIDIKTEKINADIITKFHLKLFSTKFIKGTLFRRIQQTIIHFMLLDNAMAAIHLQIKYIKLKISKK